MKYKFTSKDGYDFGWPGLKARAYSDKEDFARASIAVFEAEKHGKVLTKTSDRIYYIIDGSGTFEIDGNKIHVEKTDAIIVPKNTPYDYWADKGKKLNLFLVHTPSFDEKGEVK